MKMTLRQLLSTLTSLNVTATIYDSDGKTVLSEIKTNTYASLEDTLEARTVKEWTIKGQFVILITLDEVQETSQAPETTNDGE